MSRLLAAVLALLPGMAAAQAYEGTIVDLQYQKYDDGAGFELDSIEGTLDASWMFGRVGVQAGLVIGKEIDSSDDLDFQHYRGLALHLTTDVSDSLRLGALVASDNRFDGIYLYAAEALYMNGPLRVEGRVGDNFNNGDSFSLLEVKGAFTIAGGLSARAGLHYSDYGDAGYYRVLSVGAGYQMNNGAELYADISRHANDFGAGSPTLNGSLFDLGVRFNLGGGNSDKAFSYQPLN
ncbi:hypothetical protein [Tabrizicola sp.]|uniref:hypothetical protein n=1 Tax=Tabrizicola sp. TaxID=2005166 RepID=UPI00286D37DB|nr:hypothetical protein [Tabrizicola sp.]